MLARLNAIESIRGTEADDRYQHLGVRSTRQNLSRFGGRDS
jgi:hypothetical protein